MYEKVPVIAASELLAEFVFDFDAILVFWNTIFQFDTYKCLYFDTDETYYGFPWQNEYDIACRNAVRQYLRDKFPGCTRALVDLSC